MCLFICSISYAQDTTQLSLLFLGDIMQHDSQITAAYHTKTGKYDYAPCFQYIKPWLQEADLTIGNLELTLAGKPFKGYPQFSAPDELAIALQDAGVDILVTANNHSLDRRKKGLERTIDVLDSLGIHYTGTFKDTVHRMNDYPLIVRKNGFKLALLNYTYGTNGIPVTKPNIVNLIDTALIRKDVDYAKKFLPDAIIVFMHWGLEYQSQPSKEQKRLAQFCFDLGANIVIGSHPHVLQPIQHDTVRNQVVVYSLGNFVSGQRDRYKNGGAMVNLALTKISTDSSSVTTLSDVSYTLEWVYRTVDASKKYYIMPVVAFESDTSDTIKDATSRAQLKQFATDSRKLFSTYSRGIPEYTVKPADTLIRYAIALHESMTLPEWDDVRVAYWNDFEVRKTSGETKQWLLGDFATEAEAQRVINRFVRHVPEFSVGIIKLVNGNVTD